MRGVRAERPEGLVAALRAALGGDEPTLIEVPVGEMPDAWRVLTRFGSG